jgi:hypothetical protein
MKQNEIFKHINISYFSFNRYLPESVNSEKKKKLDNVFKTY